MADDEYVGSPAIDSRGAEHKKNPLLSHKRREQAINRMESKKEVAESHSALRSVALFSLNPGAE